MASNSESKAADGAMFEAQSNARRESMSGPVGAAWLVAIWLAAVLVGVLLLVADVIHADTVPVRHTQGVVHAFLVLQTLDGNTIADGDLTQISRADRVTGRLVFHFKDGSLYDETFVFTQRGAFHLLSDHLIEKGASFRPPMETSLDTSTGQMTVRYTDDDGKGKVVSERLKLPPDTNFWVLGCDAPIFLKSEGPLYQAGPIWRIEPVSPARPQTTAQQ
jgi:hypothetical protein